MGATLLALAKAIYFLIRVVFVLPTNPTRKLKSKLENSAFQNWGQEDNISLLGLETPIKIHSNSKRKREMY